MAPRSRRRDEGIPRGTQISKKLSWLLRHGAEKEGLNLGPGGYANLKDVLASRTIRPLRATMPEIAELVAENDKQRFSLIPVRQLAIVQPNSIQNTATSNMADWVASLDIKDETDPSGFLIRANQGHSIKIDNKGLLTKMNLDSEGSFPKTVVHGTTRRAWPSIVASAGLKPMTRNHIHLAAGLPAGFNTMEEEVEQATDNAGNDGSIVEAPVISGMRVSSTILIYIDVRKAIGMGLDFWRSDNGVILTDGGERKLLPLECFTRVEERGEQSCLLAKDGVVLRDLSGKPKKGDTFH